MTTPQPLAANVSGPAMQAPTPALAKDDHAS